MIGAQLGNELLFLWLGNRNIFKLSGVQQVNSSDLLLNLPILKLLNQGRNVLRIKLSSKLSIVRRGAPAIPQTAIQADYEASMA